MSQALRNMTYQEHQRAIARRFASKSGGLGYIAARRALAIERLGGPENVKNLSEARIAHMEKELEARRDKKKSEKDGEE